MYPGVIIDFNDQSDISVKLPVSEVRNAPLFGAVFTSDKGPEGWMRVSGEEFFKTYGKNISFAKHGQPLLQAAMSINAGAELFCKRLVASDATLANIGIVATLENTTTQAVDADGNKLYIDDSGNETTEVTDTPCNTTATSIRYSTKFASEVSTIDEAVESIKGSLAENEHLLYVFADNGRGVSKKRIKIVPNYKLSKSLSYVLYTLSIIEGVSEEESMTFSINPDLIVSDENISLDSMVNTHSTQIDCVAPEGGIRGLIEALAANLDIDDPDELLGYDVLFGCTNKGEAIPGVTVDPLGVDLQYTNGQLMSGGSNGIFGSVPFSEDKDVRDEYIKQACAAFDGTYSTEIFNIDHNMLDAIVDANYPKEVKDAIATLATFREDFMFFRDQGIGKTDLALIEETSKGEIKNMFAGSYAQSYDVFDPYTKKQITVTIGYSLAQMLVDHFNNGYILPTAGIKYNMIIKDAIYGTLSFAPAICPGPDGNQKEKLDDMRVNYASYIDNQLVIETLYTSQDKNSQWSYINNVMGIQKVIKAIRARCPAIRYSFIDAEDLKRYKADVEEVIAPFANQFNQLSIEFMKDATYSVNKIFYAVLKVAYKDFVQTEWFTITALSAAETTNQ